MQMTDATKRLLAYALCLLPLLSGCAAVPRPQALAPESCWRKQEQSSERVRMYPQLGAAQILSAAEQVLRLSGGQDMQVERTAHDLRAEFHRTRTFYAFLVAHQASVWDRWVVATRSEGDATRVCVWVQGQYFSDTFVFGAEPVTHVIYPASSIEQAPGQGFKPRAKAYPVRYATFWRRLDYVLGLNRAGWRCEDAGPSGKAQAWDLLCHALADAAAPDGPAE